MSLNDVGAPLPTRLTILRPDDVGVPTQAVYLYTNTARTSPGDKNSLTGAAAGLPRERQSGQKMADKSAGSGIPQPSRWRAGVYWPAAVTRHTVLPTSSA